MGNLLRGAAVHKQFKINKKSIKYQFFKKISNFQFFRKFQNFEISFFIDPGLDFKIPGGSGDQK